MCTVCRLHKLWGRFGEQGLESLHHVANEAIKKNFGSNKRAGLQSFMKTQLVLACTDMKEFERRPRHTPAPAAPVPAAPAASNANVDGNDVDDQNWDDADDQIWNDVDDEIWIVVDDEDEEEGVAVDYGNNDDNDGNVIVYDDDEEDEDE